MSGKKKIYYRTERELEGLQYIAKVIDFGVSLAIASAFNEMLNAQLLLAQTPLHRQRLKQALRLGYNKANMHTNLIRSCMADVAFYNEYADAVVDYAHNDITLILASLKQTLDNANVPYSLAIAQTELARILLHLARLQFLDAIEATKKKFGYDYAKYFTEFDISDVCAAWDKVCNLTHSLGGKKFNVDLNTKENELLVQKISKKFVEGDYIDDCLAEARVVKQDFNNEIIVKE